MLAERRLIIIISNKGRVTMRLKTKESSVFAVVRNLWYKHAEEGEK